MGSRGRVTEILARARTAKTYLPSTTTVSVGYLNIRARRCLRSLRVMSGIVLAMGVTAAPRITALVEMRVGKPTLFNRQEGWAISGPSLLRTVDGGSTWKPVKIIIGGRETSGEIRGTYFVSASTAWVTLAHHDGLRDRLGLSPEFVATHDGGATWRAESLPKAEWFFDSLFATADPNGPIWLGGQVSQEGDAPVGRMECPQRVKGFTWRSAIYFRPAPGLPWEEQRTPAQNGCPVSIIRFLDKLRGVAIAGTAIMFSDDEGQHWQPSAIRSSGKIRSPVNLQFRSREGWIGCDYGEILHTVDGGRHWDEIVKPGAIWSRARGFGAWGAVHFTSAASGFTLGGGGELFETDDGGRTWTKVALSERIVNFSCAESVCLLASDEKLYRLEAE